MNKKVFMFVLSILVVLVAISSVSSAICKGYDGYYRDCGYIYGPDGYHSGYGGGYGYGDGAIYLDGYKKYNPINDYYIFKGPGYDRTRYDADVRYVSNDRSRGRDRVYVIKDERTFEYSPKNVDDGRQLRVFIDDDLKYSRDDYNDQYGKRANVAYRVKTDIKRNVDPIWLDGDPYHNVKLHRNIRSWKLTGEEHCPDRWICYRKSWY